MEENLSSFILSTNLENWSSIKSCAVGREERNIYIDTTVAPQIKDFMERKQLLYNG